MEEKKLRSDMENHLSQAYLAPIALLRGCGWTQEDLEKPRVAIINTWSEMNPGHMHLREVAQEVKKGIREAGGTGFEFNCVSVCDSVAEGPYVLPSRDLLVNEAEVLIEGNKMDAAVFIGTCDKVIPGLLMAAARLDLPSIIVTGGYMRTGVTTKGQKVDFVDIGLTVSHVAAGEATQEELQDVIEHACPGPGACGMMGTANSMSIICETIGMSLPGNSTICGESPELMEYARRAGRRVMELYKEGITARQIITPASITNAIKVCMAVGGSSNTIIHIPAIATEAEYDMQCSGIYTQASNDIPLLVGIKPNGAFTMQDFDAAGGLRALLNILQEKLDTACLNVTGRSMAEEIKGYTVKDPAIIHTMENPVSNEGGLVLCKGNLVPEGAIVKRSAVSPKMMKFRGRAKVFYSADEAVKALRTGQIVPGDAVFILYMGIKAGPETAYGFATELKGSHLRDEVCAITDGRTSGAAAGAFFQYASPEAAVGGPLAIVQDGDYIYYDIDKMELNIELSEEEIEERLKTVELKLEPKKGYLSVYRHCVGSILKGAVLR